MIHNNQLSNKVLYLIKRRNSAIEALEVIEQKRLEIETSLLLHRDSSCCVDLSALSDITRIKASIDSEMWSVLFTEYGLYNPMDDQEINLLNSWLYSESPPDFIFINIVAVLNYFLNLSDTMLFNQTLVKLFTQLETDVSQHQTANSKPVKIFRLKDCLSKKDSHTVSIDYIDRINVLDHIFLTLSRNPIKKDGLLKEINTALLKNESLDKKDFIIRKENNRDLIIEVVSDKLLYEINRIIDDWDEENQRIGFMPIINSCIAQLSI